VLEALNTELSTMEEDDEGDSDCEIEQPEGLDGKAT